MDINLLLILRNSTCPAPSEPPPSAKSAEEKARLDKVLPIISQSKAPVIVICPRGKTGAKNSYDYLLSKGVAEDRMKILEDGIAGWEFPQLFVKGR